MIRGGLVGRLSGSIFREVYSGELGCVLSEVHNGEGCVDDDSLTFVLTACMILMRADERENND